MNQQLSYEDYQTIYRNLNKILSESLSYAEYQAYIAQTKSIILDQIITGGEIDKTIQQLPRKTGMYDYRTMQMYKNCRRINGYNCGNIIHNHVSTKKSKPLNFIRKFLKY